MAIRPDTFENITLEHLEVWFIPKPVSDNYPPYNLIQTSPDTYSLKLSVPGISKAQIQITIQEFVLKIRGTLPVPDPAPTMLHTGYTTKTFVREFELAPYIEVEPVITLVDGILTIGLSKNLPEASEVETELSIS